MKESILQYIWQFQQFDKKNLLTTQGASLKILKIGKLNKDSGPDFLEAKISINGVVFHGNVEIHVYSKDWYTHKHDKNTCYNNVILHVVWIENKPVVSSDGSLLPILALSNYVKEEFIEQYNSLPKANILLPCNNRLQQISQKSWDKAVKKALLKRLDSKYKFVYNLLKKNKYDSEITAYQLLARNFGFHKNNEPFYQLSKQVPWQFIQRNAPNLLYLEALLLGQAGLIPSVVNTEVHTTDYVNALITTYNYLNKKYKLQTTLNRSQWKFFRLRPANFPYIRIAQFAQILHRHPSIFSLLINTPYSKLHEVLTVKQSIYWQTHYLLEKEATKNIPGLGTSSINNIIINTVVPLLVCYGKLHQSKFYTDHAIELLHKLPAEQNVITKRLQGLGKQVKNAFESQGCIDLFQSLCYSKSCLTCYLKSQIVENPKAT